MALFRYGNSNTGGGGGGTPVMQETILWSNPDPSVAFPNKPQGISSIVGYDYIGIYYRPKANTPDTEYLAIIPISDFQSMRYPYDAVMLMTYYNAYYARAVWYVSNSQVQFSDALQVSGGGTQNGVSIPTKIVGMKMVVE